MLTHCKAVYELHGGLTAIWLGLQYALRNEVSFFAMQADLLSNRVTERPPAVAGVAPIR